MSVKRKSSTRITTQPKIKAAKVSKGSVKTTKSPKKTSTASKYEESEASTEDDEFEGFGSGDDDEDMEEDDMDSVVEYDSDEEDKLDDSGNEMDVDEDSTKINKPAKQSGTSIPHIHSFVETQKEVPSHSAQRALAKERKLQRPNGIPQEPPY